ncbi:MAG: hypothetical protein ACR2RA_09365 [Geminicoccaceae bacterium]
MTKSAATGQSAFLSPTGDTVALLPINEYAIASANIEAMTGSPPFVIWGHRPVVLLVALVLA